MVLKLFSLIDEDEMILTFEYGAQMDLKSAVLASNQ